MSPRERLFALEQFGIKLGLGNITALVQALNHPERAFPVVHVAGTNGKGSVTAMVERGLRAAGHRTGRYTSPHLTHIEERVAIDGQPIDAATFDRVAADVLDLIDRLRAAGTTEHLPTFFEATTAIAFEVFRRKEVTVGVIEVGLGGRYDATNVVTPLVTAITSIAFDHERHLGNSLAQIAFEKAGIIKAGVPVIVGGMPQEARRVIEEVARVAGAPVAEGRERPGGTAVPLALQGAHQRGNAAVAAEVLRRCDDAGLVVRRDHIITALSDVEWPARVEWLRLPSGHDVLIDAAHNPAGAEALAVYAASVMEPSPLVLGVMKDKDVDALAGAIAPAVSVFVVTEAPTPRALPAVLLAGRLRQLFPAVTVLEREQPEAALTLALESSPRAIAAGSIFLVGPLRERLIALGARPVRYPSKAPPFSLT
jgi:dihydrofolate synthase/folylpolyglutamate synthase